MDTQSLSSFSCLTCRVKFENAADQKQHFVSLWHRNSLVLKANGHSPRSLEEFEAITAKYTVAKEEPGKMYCKLCRRHFKNQNSYDNHLGSLKHKTLEKTQLQPEEHAGQPMEAGEEDDSDVEEVDSDEWDDENPIIENNCIFCLHHSRNFTKNLNHMVLAHSFFIPDVEYCIDIQGLLTYLGEKVSQGFMCLWCNEKGKTFHSSLAARNHMLDKGHCRMIYEGVALAEYTDFYDYSSTYPDQEEGQDLDEEVPDVEELDGSDYQLVLPSGVIIGHRSLMRYYKQSIDPSRAVVAVPSNNTKRLHKVLAQYRSLGWTETQMAAAARRAKDIHHMKRIQTKMNLKMGMKGNKIKQHHFRSQNP